MKLGAKILALNLITIFCALVVIVAKLRPAWILYTIHNWIDLFAWISSILMLSSMFIVGKKLWWGWLLNLGAMPFFLCIDIHYRLWGFIVFNFVCSSIAARNLVLWYRARNSDLTNSLLLSV